MRKNLTKNSIKTPLKVQKCIANLKTQNSNKKVVEIYSKPQKNYPKLQKSIQNPK
jgi:flagellar motility protein MotE (MotC chaperone)